MRIRDEEIRERAVPEANEEGFTSGNENRENFRGRVKKVETGRHQFARSGSEEVQADIKNDEEIRGVFCEERERENGRGGDGF